MFAFPNFSQLGMFSFFSCTTIERFRSSRTVASQILVDPLVFAAPPLWIAVGCDFALDTTVRKTEVDIEALLVDL